MASTLHPLVVDACQASIRSRRRSSIRSINPVGRLFATGALPSGSAIQDEPIEATPDSPPLTPLSNVHVTDGTVESRGMRHHGSLQVLNRSDIPSPTVAASPTPERQNKLERMKARFGTAFFIYFLCGWGDGVTGTVLPYFRADFNISNMTLSLLFTGSTVGFFIGTFVVEHIMNYLGRFKVREAKKSNNAIAPFFLMGAAPDTIGFSLSQSRYVTLLIGSVLHALHFVMMGSRSGFPAMFLAYALAAFARALWTTPLNAYYAIGPQQSIGYAYALWSFGGVASPLVCQAIIATGVPWHHFYFGSLVVSGLALLFVALSFKPTTNEREKEIQHAIRSLKHRESTGSTLNGSTNPSITEAGKSNTLLLALRMPYQWAFSLFVLVYCGCETTTQGFMVTYLLGVRNADPKTVGYVTSGFWGGITVGRLVWGYYTPSLSFIQRKYVIYGCLVIGLVMHLLIWFVNSNIENAFSTAVIGAVFGPIFPGSLTMANDILPMEVHMVVMALMSAFGSLGSALFPFIVGTIASAKGVHTLTYVTVPLTVSLIVTWALLPSRVRTRTTID